MFKKQSLFVLSVVLVLGLILSGCNLERPVVTTPLLPASSTTNMPGASTPSANESPTGGMQMVFVNLIDGGSVAATEGADGRPLVMVQVEVTGAVPMIVDLAANGLPAVDAGGHPLEVTNTSGALPFTAEIPWSPANGGGEYTLVVTGTSTVKDFVEATVHITVTGLPSFTATPPPLDLAGAQQRISALIQQQFGVSIPKPSVERFDFTQFPGSSRWIGSAYYRGTRYYIDLYDDTHYAWSNANYSDPAHRANGDNFVLCRPSGNFRVLTIFVDYGNTGANRAVVLAKVPVVVSWLNSLYTKFALSQGFSGALMQVEADAVYVSPPPVPGEFITADQIRTLTGNDPSAYDFLMQIDLDVNGTLAKHYFSNLLEPGGGIALQGCGTGDIKYGSIINIWSSITDATNVEGGLVMDFNHELSHLFGMLDNWPYQPGISGPDGISSDDWIPYKMFGWTDSDGDGIPEIIDPNPYGITNP